MDVDFLLFPKRNPSYGIKMMGKELIWIPRFLKNQRNTLKKPPAKKKEEEPLKKSNQGNNSLLKTNCLQIQTDELKTNSGSFLEQRSVPSSVMSSPMVSRSDSKSNNKIRELSAKKPEDNGANYSHNWYTDLQMNSKLTPSGKSNPSVLKSPQHKYFPVKGYERSGSENRFNKQSKETVKIIEHRRNSKTAGQHFGDISKDIGDSRELNELGTKNDEITNFKESMEKYVTQPFKKLTSFKIINHTDYKLPQCFFKKSHGAVKGAIFYDLKSPLKEWWNYPEPQINKNTMDTNPAEFKITYKDEVVSRIPCLLLEPETPSSKLILYFHGNGEDLNLSYTFLDYIRLFFKMRILAIEYPGYGVYINENPTTKRVSEDAEDIYEYVTKIIGYQEKDIIILGRSIGGGPAIHIAAQNSPACLGLISTFSSVKDLVRDHAGAVIPYLIQERFTNSARIKEVQSPVFILHGKMDTLIPYSHSKKLSENCISKHELHLADDMTHACFDFQEDFAEPFKNFLAKMGLTPEEKKGILPLKFPIDVYNFKLSK